MRDSELRCLARHDTKGIKSAQLHKGSCKIRDNEPKRQLDGGNRNCQRTVLDKTSLQRESEALYKIGRFKEALNTHLLSLTKQNKCEVFVDCRWEFTDALAHYENAKYYRAAGYMDKAEEEEEEEEELNKGDLEFDKICPRSDKNADYCTGVRTRLLE
ncbi:MAG: hypothetical protein ACXV8O_20770 [Methylobacter sp.]